MIFALVSLLMLSGCGGDDTKMPWEDDLGKPGDEKPGDEKPGDETPVVVEVGKPLPAWSEGYLDIHYISTGRGECAFYILPDGTTLLVDAGELSVKYDSSNDSNDAPVPQRPNENVRPYIVQARYIKHFMPAGHHAIDWCAPSHFHIDHIGSLGAVTETSAAGGYRKAGLLALFDEVPYLNVLDRAYPNYTEDAETPALDGQLAADWGKFVKWGESNALFRAARFRPGQEQIKMQYNAQQYDCRVFNICANGFVWNKHSSGAGQLVGSKSSKGNPSCCGFHLSYGKFDYIACGDLSSTPQNLMANYYRDFVGSGKLDAFKTNHHLSANSWGTQMQKVEFNPRVIINMSFYKKQPDKDLVASIYGNNFGYMWAKDFFSTSIHERAYAAAPDVYGKVDGFDGHVVLRVEPNGASYHVYMLDDTNFDYNVKSIHGPYNSK